MKGAITMKRIALVAAIALSCLSVSAYDLTGTGLTQQGEKAEDGKTLAILADESGNEVLFDAEEEPSPQRIEALGALVAELRSWSSLEIAEIRAVNMKDRLQVTAVPSGFAVDGVALEKAIPGGIQLLYKSVAEYDFKVKSGKYLVRVASVFTGEKELEAAALAAFTDPVAFIATRDPLYVQKYLTDLSEKNEAAEAKIAALQADSDAKAADFEARIAALEQVTFGASNDLKEERTSRAEQEIQALKDLLTEAQAKAEEREAQREADLAQKETELAQREADRETKDAALREADWDKLRPVLLAALTGSKPIKPEAMSKLIELKQADPALDKKNAPKALKAAGFSLSEKEIAAIFLVEFGER